MAAARRCASLAIESVAAFAVAGGVGGCAVVDAPGEVGGLAAWDEVVDVPGCAGFDGVSADVAGLGEGGGELGADVLAACGVGAPCGLCAHGGQGSRWQAPPVGVRGSRGPVPAPLCGVGLPDSTSPPCGVGQWSASRCWLRWYNQVCHSRWVMHGVPHCGHLRLAPTVVHPWLGQARLRRGGRGFLGMCVPLGPCGRLARPVPHRTFVRPQSTTASCPSTSLRAWWFTGRFPSWAAPRNPF